MTSSSWLTATAFGVVTAAGCVDQTSDRAPADLTIEVTQQALASEDGLKDAYDTFVAIFTGAGQDRRFNIGFGHHPGLSTEKLVFEGRAMRGHAVLDFDTKRVTAALVDVPSGVSADLWFVKNVAGSGRTARPESGDQLLKVGSFTGSGQTRSLNVSLGNNIGFDLDVVVVTRQGKSPTTSRLATGARTLFEKRFFRERANQGLDPVSGTVAKNVETSDARVGRGAHLFFNEKFSGNGRTCGTCHPATNNLTIDPAFIATRPASDPLFVAETNPALAQLEKPNLMRASGLILLNTDGFEDPTVKFVMRGVPHTLGMTASMDILSALTDPANLPDQALGWGGDGGPGRSALADFTFGAVFQHFTKSLQRRPGTDFRIPTQEELDSLEAFQLFTGRQKLTDVTQVQFRDPVVQNGKGLFLSPAAQCTRCHFDLTGIAFNGRNDTGVATLTPPTADRPDDDGFLHRRSFNAPPLLEAADTGPFFHNNSIATIEEATAFYLSPAFIGSPSGTNFPVQIGPDSLDQIATFLRAVNAAENLRQVRKRAVFVRNNRTTGNTSILDQAIADVGDAIEVLMAKNLHPAAQLHLRNVELTLQTARSNQDSARPPFMDNALTFLDLARTELLTADPGGQF